jgi:hypothetical protein
MQMSATGTISMSHVVALMETQGVSLRKLDIPEVDGRPTIELRNFISNGHAFPSLRELAFNLPPRKNLDADLCHIVRQSLEARYLHLRILSSSDPNRAKISRILARGPVGKQSLFTVATRLTLHGYDFSENEYHIARISFPALRALAVIDCTWEALLFNKLEPKEFPAMDALMIKSQATIHLHIFKVFVEGLERLRELIIYGEYVYFENDLFLLQHADTLRILSIYQAPNFCCFDLSNTTEVATFTALTSLCHLSVFSTTVWFEDEDVSVDKQNSEWDIFLVYVNLLETFAFNHADCI